MIQKRTPATHRRKTKGRLRIIAGTKEQNQETAAQLPQFEPIVMDSYVVAKNSRDRAAKLDAIEKTRTAIEGQMAELLEKLGLSADEDGFKRGLFILAATFLGLGTIAVPNPRLSNRHACKWLPADDDFFRSKVEQFLEDGLGITAALRKIAREPEIWQKLPQPSGPHRPVETEYHRFERYKKRWKHLQQLNPIWSEALGLHLTEEDILRVPSDIDRRVEPTHEKQASTRASDEGLTMGSTTFGH